MPTTPKPPPDRAFFLLTGLALVVVGGGLFGIGGGLASFVAAACTALGGLLLSIFAIATGVLIALDEHRRRN